MPASLWVDSAAVHCIGEVYRAAGDSVRPSKTPWLEHKSADKVDAVGYVISYHDMH